MDPRANGFSLICPTVKHTTESTLADTFYRRARTRASDVLLSRLREREREGGGITLSVQVARGVRLPPETLWRRVFPFACSSSPRLSVPLSGEWYISSRGYFLSLSRRYRRPFKRCSRRYITLIRSLTVFCRGGCLVPRTRCFREFVVAPFDRLPASVRFSKNEILPWTINFNAWTEE